MGSRRCRRPRGRRSSGVGSARLLGVLLASTPAAAVGRFSTVGALIEDFKQAGFDDSHRTAALSQLTTAARLRNAISSPLTSSAGSSVVVGKTLWPHSFKCPPHGAGVGNWTTPLDKHHWIRHKYWSEIDLCESSFGLWTKGCGPICPLRAAVIGSAVDLRPGQLVLDVGSACGHFALWFHEWFGARTLGVDFVDSAVEFAQRKVSSVVPALFCWLDVGTKGLSWVPPRTVDLAVAVSVLHYLRTDTDRFEVGDEPVTRWRVTNASEGRTSCTELRNTKRTQCRAARDMFRTVRVGGHVWIAHNGSYQRKWDPKRVWGRGYWRCCFSRELLAGVVEVREVPELDLFMNRKEWDPTYSVVIRRLA